MQLLLSSDSKLPEERHRVLYFTVQRLRLGTGRNGRKREDPP